MNQVDEIENFQGIKSYSQVICATKAVSVPQLNNAFKVHERQFRYFKNLTSLTQGDEENGTC